MKPLKYTLLFAVNLLFTNATTSTPVKNAYTLSADYAITINGTSNLHNWDEKVKTVTGQGIVNFIDETSFDLESINIKMDVHSIKSDMGSIMNNNTYKALKADANPQIIFTLTTPIKSIQTKSAEKTISAKGNLTIAGVTKVVDMQVKISMPEHGKLIFEGFQTIQMTDYGIKPPVALFGTLKTGDAITINFKTNFLINN
jgi:polyisoprenoid-binding protein YceI